MKDLKPLLLAALLSPFFITATSCDNEDSYVFVTDQNPNYTYLQLAEEFIYHMRNDLGVDLELVKLNTNYFNYIVVEDVRLYDPRTGPYYTAYYIGEYFPDENIASYVTRYNKSFVYGLSASTNGTYSGVNSFGNFVRF